MSNIKSVLNEYKNYFEIELRKALDELAVRGAEEPILSAVRYSIEDGGKRIRPALAFMGAEIIGCDKSDVLNFALAIECVHSYSLVHDDLPSMDNDTLRRGKPTTHVKFGEGMAVLTGDALLNLAFEMALSKEDFTRYDAKALKYFATMSGIMGMVGGQCIDIRDNSKKDMDFEGLIELYKLKTSCLISSALVSGAIAVGASDEEIEALKLYANNIGIIFQIVDDILDVTATEAELGKNIGSDAEHGKVTSLAFMSMDEAKKYIEKLNNEAIDALSIFGDKAADLIALSDMLIHRKN